MKRNKRILKREERGITLIALVITIIVLLILAGVSIAMLTGENGILTQAQNAKNKTEEVEEKEKIQLAITEAQLGDNGYQKLTEENLQKEINEQFGDGAVRVYPNEKNAFSFIFQNKEANYRLEKDGTLNKIDIALKINNLEEFRNFMNEVNSGNSYKDEYVYLLENINLTGETWDVIGSYTDDTTNNSFAGTFEGNNRTINGLNIKKDGETVGLFAYNTGTIRDIILESGSITGVTRVAGIVAINNGTIENCHNNGVIISMTGSKPAGGGIAGRSAGKIRYCSNFSNIENDSGSYIGGIVASLVNNGELSNCYNTGIIKGKSTVGGVVGQANKSKVMYSYNIGNIKAESAVGGIAGSCINSKIIYNYNTGNVEGSNDLLDVNTCVGGIIGILRGEVIGCYNLGIIKGYSSVGGIVGRTYEDNSGEEYEYKISDCYNIGLVQGTGGAIDIGNIIGGAYANIELVINNNYFSREISNIDGIGKISDNIKIDKMDINEKTITYMKTSAFVNDLNKAEEVFIFDTGINDGYPILRWQVE